VGVLIDRSTRVVVQGITGREGSFHTQQMQAYGTRVVAGVVPGKGGSETLGVPVFDTVREAVEATGADASFVIVPPPFAADAVMEASASASPRAPRCWTWCVRSPSWSARRCGSSAPTARG
jgi:succinyl-CoA synthetase alpha subunit